MAATGPAWPKARGYSIANRKQAMLDFSRFTPKSLFTPVTGPVENLGSILICFLREIERGTVVS